MKKNIINAVAIVALFSAVVYAQEVKVLDGKALAEWKAIAVDTAKTVDERLEADARWGKMKSWDDEKSHAARWANMKTISGSKAAKRALSLHAGIAQAHVRGKRRAEALSACQSLVGPAESKAMEAGNCMGLAAICQRAGRKWKEPKFVALSLRFYTAPANLYNRPHLDPYQASFFYLFPLRKFSPFTTAEQLKILNAWKPLFLGQVENYGFDTGKIRVLAEMKKRGVITPAEERATIRKYSNYLASETVGANKGKAKAAFAEIAVMIEAWSVVDKYMPEVKK